MSEHKRWALLQYRFIPCAYAEGAGVFPHQVWWVRRGGDSSRDYAQCLKSEVVHKTKGNGGGGLWAGGAAGFFNMARGCWPWAFAPAFCGAMAGSVCPHPPVTALFGSLFGCGEGSSSEFWKHV